MEKVLLVVDGSNMIFRGWNAANYNRKDGDFIPASRCMAQILVSDIKVVKATHCAVVFDYPGKCFRHRLYPEYKANRDHSADACIEQIPETIKLLKSMGIKTIYHKGEEGDDVVGSLARQNRSKALVYIDSRDKDYAQLVRQNRIHLLLPKGEILDENGVKEKFGVMPRQIREFLMLQGDTIDNIAGVDKCGPKTAAKWLEQWGSIRNLLKNKDKLGPGMRANLERASSFFSTSAVLVKIKTGIDLGVSLDDCRIYRPGSAFKKECAKHGFHSLYKSVMNSMDSLGL